MPIPEDRHSPTAFEASSAGPSEGAAHRHRRGAPGFWVALDVLTMAFSAAVALYCKFHTELFSGGYRPESGLRYEIFGVQFLGALLLGYALALIGISRRLHLYHPERYASALREQWRSLQASLVAGMLLAGGFYLAQSGKTSRRALVLYIVLVSVLLSARRMAYRIVMARRYALGLERRNVLIVGNGPEAHALRHYLESSQRMGFAFKGFVNLPGLGEKLSSDSGEVAGTLDRIFRHARRLFIDEIYLTVPCSPSVGRRLLSRAKESDIDLRVIPDMLDGLAWNSPIEYIGQLPTIPLYASQVPEVGLMIKRAMDIALSALAVILFFPLGVAAAICIKLDSPGPVFYLSERIGKKGRIFRCIKFRTMVADAEERRSELMHLNERDGVLFKVTNDPRITRIGRLLRQYSIDELPQFLNVLEGEMSIVGPRPPLASEVKSYELEHLRRLDVLPGITGLWQVLARQDPSFLSYVSLDMTYIEQWSLWLDIKILFLTVKVVVAGTGT